MNGVFALLGTLTRLFVDIVQGFYAKRTAARSGASSADAKTGAVTVVQRTSSDLKLNPHLHVVFLDGAYHEQGAELAWQTLGHLQTAHDLRHVVDRQRVILCSYRECKVRGIEAGLIVLKVRLFVLRHLPPHHSRVGLLLPGPGSLVANHRYGW
jgi:hypothetical protein